MGKLAGRTPTGLLLLPSDLVKDNPVTQCSHTSINIAGHMGEAATRVAIETPRHPDTRKGPQWREGWTGETTNTQNEGVGWYQS